MIRRPPRSTRTDPLVPYTTLFRSPTIFVPDLQKGVAATRVCLSNDRIESTYKARGNSIELQHRLRQGVQISALPDSRSEEHTSELQSLMRISYAVFCLKKNKHTQTHHNIKQIQRRPRQNNTT